MTESLGENIKLYRKKNKLLQKDLAVLLKLSKHKVSVLETGKQYPAIDEFVSICEMLNVSGDELLNLPANLEYPMEKFNDGLGKKLINLREKYDYKQNVMADILGISMSTLSKYEKGSRIPTLMRIKNICEIFQVSSDFMLGIKKKKVN